MSTLPSKEELQKARNKTVPDVITPDLKILFSGINPGLYTAYVGHHFARPGNRFWKALYASGLTPRLLEPKEENQLLKYGIGITNMVSRASALASEIPAAEFAEAKKTLVIKIEKYQPQNVVFLGVEAYRHTFNKKNITIGIQEEKIGKSAIWIMPNPSGLNAHYHQTAFNSLFMKLKQAVEKSI